MTSTEIENLRVEKLKEINATREQLNLVCEERHKKMKELEILTEAIRQAKHNLAVKKTEAEILQSEYWRSKQ